MEKNWAGDGMKGTAIVDALDEFIINCIVAACAALLCARTAFSNAGRPGMNSLE